MLPKKNRVNKKGIDLLFIKGKSVASPHLTFKFFIKKSLPPQISFIVPKSVSKLAVKRNLLRRKGYSILKKCIKQYTVPLVGIFVFKKYQEDVSVLENEIKNILNKIN